MVGDQVLRIGEVGEAREHLLLHRLRRLVLLVEDDPRHVLERGDRVGHEHRHVRRLAHARDQRARVLHHLIRIELRRALLGLAVQAAEVRGVVLVELERDLELGHCLGTLHALGESPRGRPLYQYRAYSIKRGTERAQSPSHCCATRVPGEAPSSSCANTGSRKPVSSWSRRPACASRVSPPREMRASSRASSSTLCRVMPGSAPSVGGGVESWPSRTANTFATLASAIVPRAFRSSASSAPRCRASSLASALFR